MPTGIPTNNNFSLETTEHILNELEKLQEQKRTYYIGLDLAQERDQSFTHFHLTALDTNGDLSKETY